MGLDAKEIILSNSVSVLTRRKKHTMPHPPHGACNEDLEAQHLELCFSHASLFVYTYSSFFRLYFATRAE